MKDFGILLIGVFKGKLSNLSILNGYKSMKVILHSSLISLFHFNAIQQKT
mgnify:CR=1 FL=1